MSRDDSNQLKLDESFDVNRALAYAPPFKIDFSKVKTPPTDWLSQLETMCCDYNSTLKKPFAKHTGKDATYTLKKELIDQLQVIYYRLSGDLDVQLGKLSDNQRTSILLKLTEEIQACTAGFHNRVNAIVTSFEGVASLAQLLTQVRQSLVEKTAARLTNEVHATNRVTVIASTAGFGVKPTLLGDIHPGRLTDEEIQKALQETFESEYVPFNLPILLCDQLRGILASVGYHGRHADSYDINDSKTIAMVIEHCLTDSTENTAALEKSKAGYTKYFVIDEDVYDKEKDEYQTYIRDVNWPKIQKLFLAALGREKYFVKEPTMPTLYWYALYHTTEETLVETRRIIEESISKNQYQAFNRITALKSSDPHLYRAISEILVEKINIHQLIAAFYASDIHRDLINIAEVMTIVLEKCNASDLAKELSEKITTGDFAGTNGFYYLMVALNNAALENAADSVKTISALAVTLIEKCDASDLAKGLSEKKTTGDFAGTNGFYWLIAALNNAASKNAADSVKTISALAVTLIKKCNASDLAKGLSEKRTAADFAGTNGFYRLIAALNNAAFKNAADSVKTISALAVTLIEKCDASDLAKGLSEKRTTGDDAGTHGFYCLMAALNNATSTNAADSVKTISALAVTLIEKCDASDLAKGLSEKKTTGDFAGTNGFYWLIAALNNAASKNAADSVKTISALAVTLIEKCNTSDLAKELSEKITTGNFAGTNGFYWLIAALDNAASKNAADSVKTISALAVTLIEKCNASDLAKGLSEKRIVGDDAGTHGFYWLMEAVINVIKIKDVESTQIACSLLFRLLGKLKKESLPVDVQAIFLKHKTVLQDSLKAYLSQIDSVLQLKAVSCTDTMLGVLIDHQVHFIKKPQSNTRLLVDSCIFKKSPIDRIKYISIQLSKKKEKYYLELNSFFPRNKKLVNTKLKTLEGILKLTNDIIDMKKGVIDYSVFQNDMKKIIDDAQENKFLIQDDKKINELFTALDQAICSLSSAASPTSHAPSPTPMDDANVSPRRQ